MYNFLQRIHQPGVIIQIGTTNQIYLTADNSINKTRLKDLVDSKQNVYFLAGVKKLKGLLRAADADVRLKNYLYFDFDLRKESNYKLNSQKIIEKTKSIGNKLNQSNLFNGYSYLIFTGNGLHIVYIGDPIKIKSQNDINTFKFGMQYLGQLLSNEIGFSYDSSCTNVSRIMRLPGSWNQEKSLDDNGQEVKGNYIKSKIIIEQNTESKLLKKVMEHGRKEIKRKKELAEQKIAPTRTGSDFNYSGSSIDEAINNYPIEVLVGEHTGLKYDGVKNFYDANSGKAAFYKGTDPATGNNNFIITSSSRHLSNKYLGYCPFLFMRVHHSLTAYETYKFFENKSSEITKLAKQKRTNYIVNKEKDFFKRLQNIKKNKIL
jgi:hypothetical protein